MPDSGAVAGASRRFDHSPPRRGYLEWFHLACQALLLNTVWLAVSALVLTAPAATVALFAAVHRWRTAGEAPSVRAFLREVRGRFWRDLLLAAAVSAAAVFAWVDLAVIGHMGGQRRIVLMLWLGCVAGAAVASVFGTAVAGTERPRLALTASLRRTVLGSMRLAARRPGRALAALAVVVGGAVLVSVSPICVIAIGVAVAVPIERLAYAHRRRP